MQNIPKELWMMIPIEERAVLVEHFNLEKTGYTEVHDNTVVSDGYTTEDLRVLTAEAMADFVGSSAEESMFRLWELTVAKARSVANPPTGMVGEGGIVEDVPAPNDETIVIGKTHAPTKKAAKK